MKSIYFLLPQSTYASANMEVSGGAMVLGKLPVPWRPTVWMVVHKGLLRLQ